MSRSPLSPVNRSLTNTPKEQTLSPKEEVTGSFASSPVIPTRELTDEERELHAFQIDEFALAEKKARLAITHEERSERSTADFAGFHRDGVASAERSTAERIAREAEKKAQADRTATAQLKTTGLLGKANRPSAPKPPQKEKEKNCMCTMS